MKDAVSTSILSRRWRHLWRLSLENLDLDNAFAKNLDDNDFVKYVNHILAQLHCGTTIESFFVRRYLRPPEKYGHEIDKWIQFGIDKKVQKLDINLSRKFSLPSDDKYHKKLYVFPHWLYGNQKKESPLKKLTLSSCTFNLPPQFSHFRSLNSLTLKCARMTQTNLINILSNCLSLKWLTMEMCRCSKRLKFTSTGSSCTSLKLNHLNIDNCDNLELVDIRDLENLNTFEFYGDMLLELLCNEKAPVTRVYYDQFYPLDNEFLYANQDLKLARYFPRLETLLYSSPRMKVINSKA